MQVLAGGQRRALNPLKFVANEIKIAVVVVGTRMRLTPINQSGCSEPL